MPQPSVSTEEVRSIADRLCMELSAEEVDRFADRVSQLLDIYAPLESMGYSLGERSEYSIRNIVFDPDEREDPYNAYITRFELSATDESETTGALAGVDVALKDNIAVAGVPMTCGSRVFEGATPQRNATVVDSLVRSGARIVGKTNQTELAFGPAGRHSRYGPILNPVDPDRLAGGSSGGSAAAVAAGDVDAALGSDTGGSVRVPAALCGVVGFKPTWGTVPRFGFVEMAYTLDHIGPIARDVTTAARVFDVVGGRDRRDPSSLRADAVPIGECARLVEEAPPIEEFTVGVPEEFYGEGVDREVRSAVRGTIDRLEDAGVAVESVSVPTAEWAPSLTNAILVTEFAASFLARGAPLHRRQTVDAAWHEAAAAAIRGRAGQFGDLVRTKAIEGSYLLSHYDGRHYVRARNVRARLEAEFRAVLEDVDALVTPTVPTVAPELDPASTESGADDWAIQLVSNTRAGNLTGYPALTVPCGEVDGLPVGVQFLGGEADDATVLQLGRAFERFVETG